MWPGHNFFIFGVWPFVECGKIFLWFLLFFFVFFSVTLPGTNAPRSAVTRGKPSLFGFFSLPGLFEPAFWLILHLVRLWSVFLVFLSGFFLFWCVFAFWLLLAQNFYVVFLGFSGVVSNY